MQEMNNNHELNNFESLQINLASTEKILEWSHGEVTKPETINYRTLKPEKDGLFCQKIFGPMKDWECACGKYKRVKYKGYVCPQCGVEVTKAKVRRERMGHIELAAPVSHIWYFKGIPSRMGIILSVTPRNLEKVLYFAEYIVIEPGDSPFEKKQVISEAEYKTAKEEYKTGFRAGMGAEAVRELLAEIDLEELSEELKTELKTATGQKKAKIVKKLEVVEALRLSGNRPENMILEVVPVIPPDLRPMVQLDGGRFATSDLNDLYRRVINRNNRLKKLLELGAPDIIVRNEKRMLQEAVDSLIDNGRRGRAVTGPGSRPLKSLSDMLKGKQGRFRQNLLGKRVDYSGRSVIVVGPELRFWQCGLPKKMALELFKPFIMKELVERGLAHNIKSAKRMVEKVRPEVWDVLEEVIKEHPVMLNRAPTLHRLGIQAFEPVLVEGKAIKLHPLACTAFNADFDGDQMAVHVPLSVEAQAEARFLMLSVNNILAPKDGSPITTPTQDMILGAYYLTLPGICRKVEGGKTFDRIDEFGDEEKNRADGFERIPEKGDGMIFTDIDEMMMAYQNGEVSTHAKIKVRVEFEDGKHIIESTVGRFIYNAEIPQDLGFVDRTVDPYGLEINFLCTKKELGKIINKCYKKHGNTGTAIMLDYIKDMGYHYSTKAAVTIGVSDMEIPSEKWDIIAEAEAKVEDVEEFFDEGLMTDSERYDKIIEIWTKTTDRVADALMDTLGAENNLNIMATSGARGSKNQIKQVGGMRGLMANATGHTVEIPIKSNFREGLSILEYFISSNGARKGLADTALRTADSGYLTRRLVDVSHNVIIREEDCGNDVGIKIREFPGIEPLSERITGRTVAKDVINPLTGEIIVSKNEEISDAQASAIEAAGIEEVEIRSIMTCRCRNGVCAKCYGRNLATYEHVNVGESVGIIAAQSIGEPGTQLTMRTFHTGGVAGGDITQGLPRVEELFEARKPKGLAQICKKDGEVKEIHTTSDEKTEIVVTADSGEDMSYIAPYGAKLNVKVGDRVEAATGLTAGPLYPQDILEVLKEKQAKINMEREARGEEPVNEVSLEVQGIFNYMIKEVQSVYRLQGVDISDKHIEAIVSQMLSRVKIKEAGDTDLLPGVQYDKFKVEDVNKEVIAKGGEPATFEQVLLGITKAAVTTDSFLSAASFQETTKVLTDAAIKGKTDHLVGLKENVIIGKLIPAGTGVGQYRGIDIDYGENQEMMDNWDNVPEDLDEEFLRVDGDLPETLVEDVDLAEVLSEVSAEISEEVLEEE